MRLKNWYLYRLLEPDHVFFQLNFILLFTWHVLPLFLDFLHIHCIQILNLYNHRDGVNWINTLNYSTRMVIKNQHLEVISIISGNILQAKLQITTINFILLNTARSDVYKHKRKKKTEHSWRTSWFCLLKYGGILTPSIVSYIVIITVIFKL